MSVEIERRRTGAHSQIPRTSDWDMAIDIDGGKGEKRQLVGKAGDFDVYAYQRYSTERRIPRPYPARKFTWGPERDIARLPSVKVIGSHPTPAERQLSPQISIDGGQFATKRSTDDFRSQYPDITERKYARASYRPMRKQDWGPFAKWTNQKLGFMSGQQRYLANFPAMCAIRSNINQVVTRLQKRVKR